ncbi:hypothetical protein RHMOL_Rhmol06G0067200 [Rhododendron molle]|uniref:Uncharacterized protein n=1 Tax=Rhododendron molle TaxID=49168 RepID=A0ACC0N9N3_RHOML|nr:hypothetical protein RHMOL_Rhmol06G0067200 [Rhododendron molle]
MGCTATFSTQNKVMAPSFWPPVKERREALFRSDRRPYLGCFRQVGGGFFSPQTYRSWI